jgi:hypothetical protein
MNAPLVSSGVIVPCTASKVPAALKPRRKMLPLLAVTPVKALPVAASVVGVA